MLKSIYLAYSMRIILLESVPSFQETLIGCLGDLERFRKAVDETDIRDHKAFAGVSRYWHNQDEPLKYSTKALVWTKCCDKKAVFCQKKDASNIMNSSKSRNQKLLSQMIGRCASSKYRANSQSIPPTP